MVARGRGFIGWPLVLILLILLLHGMLLPLAGFIDCNYFLSVSLSVWLCHKPASVCSVFLTVKICCLRRTPAISWY